MCICLLRKLLNLVRITIMHRYHRAIGVNIVFILLHSLSRLLVAT